jgi:SOS response regulatory protein OraA/RecX
LKAKLLEKGYSEKEIEDTINYLVEEGYINDYKLMERYKERAIEKGESLLKLKSKLYIKTKMEVNFSYEEEYTAAVNRIKKYRGKKDLQSVLKYLLNRGFNYSISYEIAKKFLNGEI